MEQNEHGAWHKGCYKELIYLNTPFERLTDYLFKFIYA